MRHLNTFFEVDFKKAKKAIQTAHGFDFSHMKQKVLRV
jgi:hypothetical protein